MTKPLNPEQLSELVKNQVIYEVSNGQEWVVENIDRNEYTRLAILRKKDDPNWGTYTVNEIMAAEFSLNKPTAKEIKITQKRIQKNIQRLGDPNYFACSCSTEMGISPIFQKKLCCNVL